MVIVCKFVWFHVIWNILGCLMRNPILTSSISIKYLKCVWISSSCRTISTDIPDPLSPLFSIVHCFRQVFRVTSRIGTEMLYVGSSWSSCLCSFMWRGPQEYITYEFILTSPAAQDMRDIAGKVFEYTSRNLVPMCRLRHKALQVDKHNLSIKREVFGKDILCFHAI